MALSMYPLSIASAFNHAWIGGDPSCLYYGLMGFFFSVASIMTLAIMAVVRYLVTKTPHYSGNKFDKKKISILIVFIWLYAMLWALLPVMGWGKYGPEPFGLSCSFDWAAYSDSLNRSTFLLCMFVLCTALPCIAIVLCYSGIAWKLHKAYKAIENSQNLPKSSKMERKFTLIAVLVSVGFIGCWAPYATVSFWSMFRASDSIPPEVSMLPCLFAKSSTAYNPFIYYIFSKTFRAEIKQLTCFCGRSRNLLNMTDRGSLRESQTYVNMLKRPMDADKDKLPVNNHEAETKIQFIGCE
ncbi:OPN5 protein, partial [Amia calva]|nr:OPN5 protein [Amia calva]